MTFFKCFVGFTGIFGLIFNAFSDVSRARPSMVSTAMSRMPTMSYNINGNSSVGNTSNSTSNNSNQPTDKDCIDSYTTCLKKGDVCGEKFEECTNKTLFYAKKTECASTLMQCKASGVSSLFGIANQTAFATKNSKGDYIYPTDGSILGQMIESAFINNRYDTSQCVKKYTSCLKKSDVCGQYFELCTTNTEFKRQKLFCESTLARCQSDGKKELFGSENTSSDPSSSSRLGNMIKEGGALAAVNAVATCYKVIDQCILNTCAKNPYKCKEGTNHELVKIVDGVIVDTQIEDPKKAGLNYTADLGAVNRKDIKGHIKNNCFDVIGSNKFCYATFVGNGSMPTNSQLKDEDNKESIFEEAFASRMNSAIASKVDESIEAFKKKFKSKCADTIINCAMRNCGSGVGVVCYSQSSDSTGIDITKSKEEISGGCKSIVSSDNACRFALSEWENASGKFTPADFFSQSEDISKNNFEKLFDKNTDIVGAIAALNSKLSKSFSASALDDMKKKCQRTASNCVKSLCGTDYQNCYRNRTDVSNSITKTDSTSFDRSMNKVGGVLDYTIVIGLCLDTVKNNKICEEHIKVEAARNNNSGNKNSDWNGQSNVRDGWLDAGSASVADETRIVETDENGDELCYKSKEDLSSCVCGSPNCSEDKIQTTKIEYALRQRTKSVFMDLIRDLELEAQAKYNSKITKEQNMCIAHNKGGIMGSKDIASTYMWAKLKGKKVPKNYSVMGLNEDSYLASNDLYGSFCRVKVTIQSDNKEIQKKLQEGQNWATGHFAAGDTIMCGSWIPQTELEKISESVGDKAYDKETKNMGRNVAWITAGSAIAGAIGGGFLTDHLQKNTGFGGLLGVSKKDDPVENCKKYAQMYIGIENGEEALPIGKKAISIASSVVGSNLKSIENSIEVAAGKGVNVSSSSKDKQKEIESLEKEISYLRKKAEEADKELENNELPKTDNEVEKMFDKATNSSDLRTKLLNAEEKLRKLKEGKNQSTNKDNDLSSAKANANKNMESLIGMCEGFSSKDVKNKKIARNNLIGAGIGALTAGTVAGLASADAFDRQGQEAKEKAIKDWLDTVGSQIKCYVGSEEVGTYGTTFTVDLEEE